MKQSMSRRGSYRDNAAVESFFARLKVEEAYALSCQNLSEAYSSILKCSTIEVVGIQLLDIFALLNMKIIIMKHASNPVSTFRGQEQFSLIT